MRTLIFSTREESEPLKLLLNGQVFDHASQEPGSVRNLLRYLDDDSDAIAIVVGDAFIMGWATHHPTHVLFSGKYSNAENVRTQARGRVRHHVLFDTGDVQRVTEESLTEQVAKDRIAHDAQLPETRRYYEQQVAKIREPSRTNFSDPEAL